MGGFVLCSEPLSSPKPPARDCDMIVDKPGSIGVCLGEIEEIEICFWMLLDFFGASMGPDQGPHYAGCRSSMYSMMALPASSSCLRTEMWSQPSRRSRHATKREPVLDLCTIPKDAAFPSVPQRLA